MTKAPISVVIHTKNAAATLPATLASVSGWTSEILVADMGSTDDTLKLAGQAGARIIPVPDYQFADPARNQVLAQTAAAWTLVLDADEVVPPSLKAVLIEKTADCSVSAYAIPRKNMIFGHWAQTGWWPDYVIRFFQRGAVSWPDQVHGQPLVRGNLVKLPPREELAIVHSNYDSIDSFVSRLNRYTSLEKDSPETNDDAPLEAFAHEFFRRYFQAGGWRQGEYGQALSFLQACYMLIAQLKRREGQLDPTPNHQWLAKLDHQIQGLSREYRYWFATAQIAASRNPAARLYWQVRRKFRR